MVSDSFKPYRLSRFDEWSGGLLIRFFAFALRVFFREFTVVRSGVGEESHDLSSYFGSARKNLAGDEGAAAFPTLIIANHPNGLVDAVAIYTSAGEILRGVAKATLWNEAFLRPLLRAAGAVPVMRSVDREEIAAKGLHAAGAKIQTNAESLAIVGEAMCMHSVLIFPEGRSHDDPLMSEFKTGGARMLLIAAKILRDSRGDARRQSSFKVKNERDLSFKPVGLYFEQKNKFRSRALIHYGAPVFLKDLLTDEDHDLLRTDPFHEEVVKKITTAMENSLRDLLPEASTVEELRRIRRLATLLVGGKRKLAVNEQYQWELKVKEILAGSLKQEDEVLQQLLKRMDFYFEWLDVAALSDALIRYIVSAGGSVPWVGMFLRNLQFWGSSILFSPFVFLGWAMATPIVLLSEKVGKKLAIDESEEATYKLFAGCVFGILGLGIYSFILVLLWGLFFPTGAPLMVAAPLFTLACCLAWLKYRDRRSYYLQELRLLALRSLRRKALAMAQERDDLQSLLSRYPL